MGPCMTLRGSHAVVGTAGGSGRVSSWCPPALVQQCPRSSMAAGGPLPSRAPEQVASFRVHWWIPPCAKAGVGAANE